MNAQSNQAYRPEAAAAYAAGILILATLGFTVMAILTLTGVIR